MLPRVRRGYSAPAARISLTHLCRKLHATIVNFRALLTDYFTEDACSDHDQTRRTAPYFLFVIWPLRRHEYR